MYTVGFGPIGRVSRLPGLILEPWDQAGKVQEDGSGGHIGCEGPGKGPRPPNLTFSGIFEPGQAVVAPSRQSLLRPATTRQNLHFPNEFQQRNFIIPAPEP